MLPFLGTGFQLNLGPISMGFYNSTIHCLLTMIKVWKTLKYTYTHDDDDDDDDDDYDDGGGDGGNIADDNDDDNADDGDGGAAQSCFPFLICHSKPPFSNKLVQSCQVCGLLFCQRH